MIQMVSLDTGNGTRITGMMANTRLIEPLVVRLGEHANEMKRAMQQRGMALAQGARPVMTNQQVQTLAAELLQGARCARCRVAYQQSLAPDTFWCPRSAALYTPRLLCLACKAWIHL